MYFIFILNMFQFQYGSIKRSLTASPFFSVSLFQFQYGSIKRPEDDAVFIEELLFQFQYGSIKRTKKLFNKIDAKSFNSNMVRLKEASIVVYFRLLHKFQFQYGSIKSLLNVIIIFIFLHVSIPIWFD